MDKKDLARLALRLYAQKSRLNFECVKFLYEDRPLPSFCKDKEVLFNLKQTHGGYFCDFWSDSELLSIDVPECEEDIKAGRVGDLQAMTLESLLELAQEIKNSPQGETKPHDAATSKLLELAGIAAQYRNLDMAYAEQCNDPALVNVLELRDLAQYKQSGIYPSDTEPGPAGYDLADSETFEGDYQNDLDTSAILPVETIPTSPGIEKPKAQKARSKRVVSVKTDSTPKRFRNRFISGQDTQLNNNVRLWESDSTEVKVYW